MTLFVSILICALLLSLITVSAGRLPHASISLFELRRRQKAGDTKAAETLRREELLLRLGLLFFPVQALLLLSVGFLFVYLLGWNLGIAASLITGLLCPRIARLKMAGVLADKVYSRLESGLLGFVAKYEGVLRLLFGKPAAREKRAVIGSHDELAHILEASPVFAESDRRLLKNALRFKRRSVEEVMTPKDDIVSVKYDELLGPLVLDDLHRTGHTIFPVMKDAAIVGLLDSSDHVALKSMESVYVRDVMRTDMVKINHEMPLDEALEALVSARQQLLVVVDGDNQPVGLVSLGDVVRALTGHGRH